MKLMEDKIRAEGRVLPGGILSVERFLNHQLDIDFLDALGEELYRLFGDLGVTKILTVESSGIAIASLAARHFHVPVVFAKKVPAETDGEGLYLAPVEAATRLFQVSVDKALLSAEDVILIVDDLLANGSTLIGLLGIAKSAGAEVVGCGVAIEHAAKAGGTALREAGVRVEALARIAAIDEASGIIFC